MSLSIWKFPLRLTDVQDVEVPAGAETLHVDEQHGNLCLWALVNPHPEVPKRKLTILIVGTGHPAPSPLSVDKYVGTVLTSGGDLVWHVFTRRA